MEIRPDGKRLYAAAEHSSELVMIDPEGRKVLRSFTLPDPPTGLAWTPNYEELVLTCSGHSNSVFILNPETGRTRTLASAGPGVCSPVVSIKSKAVYVCNRFENSIFLIDMVSGRELARGRAEREPVSASLAPDGRTLAVANLLPAGAANKGFISSMVSMLDDNTLRVRTNIALVNGSTSFRALAFHPSRNIVAAVHSVARFQVPTTQVEQGWMHVSALALVSAETDQLLGTVILDEARSEAADPFGVIWLSDTILCVVHAGTHKLSIIDYPALEAKLSGLPKGAIAGGFTFLKGIRSRVRLSGNGPRAAVVRNGIIYTAEFFSDSISAVDWSRRRE